ncbi:MAG: hypothetical protein NDI61_08315 [Bdellovibrionaceae bacterium]|nr:hypothetical protein [Pseudobdellovibrionaceae bacterium]
MALSLDKVKKKSAAPKKKKAGSEVSSRAATPAPPVKPTHTRPQERPWSQRGLAKAGRSPKERQASNSHVTDEWMALHEAPLFWIDVSTEAKLAALQEKLLDLEHKATALVEKPRRFLRSARRTLRALLS